QARNEEQHDAKQQNAARAEHCAEIGRRHADQHLADTEARRDPCALVESGGETAAQVRKPEGGDPAPERSHRRAEQNTDEADIGPPRIEREPRDKLASEMKRRAGGRDRREMQSHFLDRSACPAVCGGADASAAATVRPVSTVASTDMPGRTSFP